GDCRGARPGSPCSGRRRGDHRSSSRCGGGACVSRRASRRRSAGGGGRPVGGLGGGKREGGPFGRGRVGSGESPSRQGQLLGGVEPARRFDDGPVPATQKREIGPLCRGARDPV